ncbi:MAG: hypothetical protein PVJ19_01370 [Desulfobacteraceae bacterium]
MILRNSTGVYKEPVGSVTPQDDHDIHAANDIDTGSILTTADGAALIRTVDGVEASIAVGTFTGAIEIAV